MTQERRALITAGPTREPLDPVRFLSNASSGRQGVALAREGLARGWAIDLVHGPLEVGLPPGVVPHRVETAREMLVRSLELHPRSRVVIGAAAVADFRPRRALEEKRRRGGGTWVLELEPTEDVLAKLGEEKGDRVHVGFALETAGWLESAALKLEAKNLDWVVANRPEAIGRDQGHFVLLGAGGERRDLGVVTKEALARAVWEAIDLSLGARAGPPAV